MHRPIIPLTRRVGPLPLLLLATGCYSGTGGATVDTDDPPTASSAPTDGPASDPDLDSTDSSTSEGDTEGFDGEHIYNTYCVGCHAPNGLGEPAAPLVGCVRCVDVDELAAFIDTSMPRASPLNNPEASALVADYVMSTFNAIPDVSLEHIEGVIPDSDLQHAYRVTFVLAGRLPTEQEVEALTGDSETRRSATRALMDERFFYQKLKVVLNETLHTDAFDTRHSEDGGRSIFQNNITNWEPEQLFPDLLWYLAGSQNGGPYRFARRASNQALARQPLELAVYLAKGERRFSEWVTAPYVMVNAYSARSLTAFPVDPDDVTDGFATPLGPPGWESFNFDTVAPDPDRWREILDEMNFYEGGVPFLSSTSPGVYGGDDNILAFVELFPEDPFDFRPAHYTRSDGITPPLSGVLSTRAYLNRYPTTLTNLQRQRSRYAFLHFLGIDILAIEAGDEDSDIDIDDLGELDATQVDPQCVRCHEMLDPAAVAFQNWRSDGVYIKYEDSIPQDGRRSEIPANVDLGLDEEVSSDAVDGHELQWLGRAIAEHPGYPRAITEMVFDGLMGPNRPPVPTEASTSAEVARYQLENATLSLLTERFIESDLNIKDLIVEVVESAYYRADHLEPDADEDALTFVGSTRFLSPGDLSRRYYILTGRRWSEAEDSSYQLELMGRPLFSMYGGIDSLSTVNAAKESTSLMAAVLQRGAFEVACNAVVRDFARPTSERRMMRGVELDAIDEDSVRAQVAWLFLAALNLDVPNDDPRVDRLVQLFEETRLAHADGTTDIGPDNQCGLDGIEDEHHTIEAWRAVITALLIAPEFAYG